MSVNSQKYSIYTVTDNEYFLYTEVFLKSLFSKLNTELIEKVYVCNQGLTDKQLEFVKSFEQIEIINPIEKIEIQTDKVWDEAWLEKVGSKTKNLLKLVSEKPEPIVMIDVDSMFIKDFYDLLDFEKDIQVASRPFTSPPYIASFVSMNKKTSIKFLESWIKNLSKINILPKETKALCMTIEQMIGDEFKVGDLPVEQIHSYDKEKFIEENDTRITHFKGWSGSMSMKIGTKEDFESRTITRGYKKRLKEYIDV